MGTAKGLYKQRDHTYRIYNSMCT